MSKINYNKIDEIDIVDLFLLLVSEIKTILIIILLSLMCWLIYYTQQTPKYKSNIFISEAVDMKFKYDNNTNNYLKNNSLLPKNLVDQFTNNLTNYQLFSDFYNRMNHINITIC